jgi:hypothetical protein
VLLLLLLHIYQAPSDDLYDSNSSSMGPSRGSFAGQQAVGDASTTSRTAAAAASSSALQGAAASPAAVAAAAAAAAHHTWADIFSSNPSQQQAGDNNSSRSTIYRLPYALLKVSVRLPAGQTVPSWLQQLMDSDVIVPVEDWSKFVHGCAVLLPDAVRAVPYWIDDPLIDLSVQAVQAELEAKERRKEEAALAAVLAQHWAAEAAAAGSSSSSVRGASPITIASRIATSMSASLSAILPGSQQQQQQQQQHLHRLSSGSFSRRCSLDGPHRSPSNSEAGKQQAFVSQVLPVGIPGSTGVPVGSSRLCYSGSSSGGGGGGGGGGAIQGLPAVAAAATAEAAAATRGSSKVAGQAAALHVRWADEPEMDDDNSQLMLQAGSLVKRSNSSFRKFLALLRKQERPPLFRPGGWR